MNTRAAAIPGTQAVTRAVRILKLFLEQPDGIALGQIADQLDLHRTTAFRLTSALEAEGLLERGGDGTYSLGAQMAALGRRAAGQPRQLAAVAAGTLESLAAETGETVSLEALAGGDVVVVADAHVDRILSAVSYVGERWPAHTTATGKVLLAGLSRSERRLHLAHRLRALTPHTITDKRQLEAELARVRSDGFALNLEEIELGFVAIAVPVDGSFGGAPASLSIGGPKSRLSQSRLTRCLPALRRAARELTGQWTGDTA